MADPIDGAPAGALDSLETAAADWQRQRNEGVPTDTQAAQPSQRPADFSDLFESAKQFGRQVRAQGDADADLQRQLTAYRAANSDMAPEKWADVLRYSAATSLPPQVVSDHLDDLKKKVDSKALNAVLASRPQFAQLLADASKAPLAKDDAASLGMLEWGLTGRWELAPLRLAGPMELAPGLTTPDISIPVPELKVGPAWARAFRDAMGQQKLIALSNKQAVGATTPEEDEELDALEEEFGEKDYGANNLLSHGFIKLVSTAPYLMGTITARAAGAFAGGLAGGGSGAAAGAETGPGAAVTGLGGAAAGVAAGEYAGGAAWDFYQNFGPQYRQLRKLKDDSGEPLLSSEEARRFAFLASAASAAVTSYLGDKVVKNIPGAQELFAKLSGRSMVEALTERPELAASLRAFGTKYGASLLHGGAMMAAQSAANAGSIEMAKGTHGQDADLSNVGAAMKDGFVHGIEDMWLLTAIGPGREFLHEQGLSARVGDEQRTLSTLVQAAKQSKLLERDPEAFAEHLQKIVAASPDAPKHVYIPAEEWTRYWQTEKVDPGQAAATVMGDEGKGFAEAVATKGDLAIPTEQFLAKLSKDGHTEKLMEDAKLTPDGRTQRQEKEFRKEIEKKLREQAKERQPELDEGARKVHEFIRDQALAADVSPTEAEGVAKQVASFGRSMALRLNVSVEEASTLGGLNQLRILGPKGDAIANAALKRFREAVAPGASQHLNERLASMSPEARAREAYIDTNTGLLNDRGFRDLSSTKPLVGHISVEGVKYLNDNFSHDRADLLYRAVGRALHAEDPQAAKVGGDFAVHVNSEAELNGILERVRAALPEQLRAGFEVTGAAGKTLEDAAAAHRTLIDERVGKKERANPRPPNPEDANGKPLPPEKPLGLQRLGLDVHGIAFPEEKAGAVVPEELQQRIDALSDKAYFEQTYVDPKTGLLTIDGWNNIPRKAHIASIDLKGLKAINEALGSEAGDKLLRQFGEVAAHFGGASFDFARLHGDEYAAQHDDPVALQRFIETLRQKALDHVEIEGEAEGKKTVYRGAEFRDGIGRTYEEADASLNARKKLEGRESASGGQDSRDTQGLQADRNPVGGRDNLGTGDVTGGVRSADAGGAPENGKPRLGRGAQPQRFPGARTIAYFEGQPVTLHQEAFHGSPHRFEKFSLQHIGSGEGAQAFGWGLYFAGEQKVAESYRTGLTGGKPRVTLDGSDAVDAGGDTPRDMVLRRLSAAAQRHPVGDSEAIIRDARKALEDTRDMLKGDARAKIEAQLKALDELQKEHAIGFGEPGQLFRVDLPNADELLDSEKPLKQQSQKVQQAIARLQRERNTSFNEEDKASGQALYRAMIEDPDLGGSPQAASEALRSVGIPGLRYFDGVSRAKGEGTHNFVIWDDSRVNVEQTYYQPDGGGGAPRGSISFQLDPASQPVDFNINLLKGDRSTLSHETAHFLSWSLHSIATSDLATESVRKDYSDLLKWAGYDSPEQRLEFTRERAELAKAQQKGELTPEETKRLKALDAKEERISHGWEQYLAEGKAPSPELRGVFGRFKAWMLRIYRGIQGIEQQYQQQYGETLGLSDEVRGIFDRMLAADDALTKARADTLAGVPLENITEKMTPSERQQYAKALEAAKTGADEKTNSEAADIFKQEVGEERGRISAEVAKEVDSRPIYRALRFLQKGEAADIFGDQREVPDFLKNDDGEPFKLNRWEFRKKYGRELEQAMPPGVFGKTKKAGTSVDEIAPVLGFDSGKALIDAFTQAEPRDAVIERETQARMDELYAPAMKEIAAAAMSNVHNDAAAKAALMEIWAMARELNPDAAQNLRELDIDTIRETADRIVSESRVGDIQPSRYQQAERSAALKRAALRAKGKLAEAMEQAEARLLNLMLYRAAADAEKKLDRARAKLESTDDAMRGKLGLADLSYRDVHDSILEAVGLGQKQATPDARGLDAMLERAKADGQELDFDTDGIRALLADPKPWESLSVEEAQNVADAVTNIRRAATARTEVLLAGKRQAKDDFFADMADHLEQRPEQAPKPYSKTEEQKTGKLASLGRGADAILTNMETLADMLDAGDRDGPAHRLLVDSRLAGRDKAVVLEREVLNKIRAAWDNVPKEIRKLRDEQVDVGKLIPVPEAGKERGYAPVYTRDQLWMLFLNWGNEGNRQRIRDGMGWSDANVEKALGLLTEPETTFLQGVLDTIDSLYPEISRVHRERTGLDLPRVSATTIRVNGKEYRGGYFPLRGENRFSKVGEVQEGQAAAALTAPNFVKPATPRSHTKERAAKASYAVDLSWGVVPAHLAQVIHDVSYGDWVRQAAGILMDERFKALTTKYLGKERAAEFVPWLRDVANAKADSAAGAASEFTAKLGAFARNRVAVAALGLKLPTILQNVTDPFNAIQADVPAHHIAAAYAKLMNPAKWGEHPEFALSKEIAYRDANLKDNLRRELNEIGPTGHGIGKAVSETYFSLYEVLDRLTTRVGFKAAFDHALSQGLSEEQAARRADDVVRQMWASHDVGEKARVLRDKRGLGAFLMFYGFASKNYNSLRRRVDGIYRTFTNEEATAGDKFRAVGDLAGKMMALGVVGASAAYLAGRGPRRDEDAKKWLALRVLLEPLNTVPFVGPMVEHLIAGQKVSTRAAPELAMATDLIDRATETYRKAVKGESVKEDVALDSILLLVGLAGGPVGQVNATGGYLKQIGTGEAKPRNALDVASGLFYGQRKNQPRNPISDVADLAGGRQ